MKIPYYRLGVLSKFCCFFLQSSQNTKQFEFTSVDTPPNKKKKKMEKFVRAVLQKWLDRDDDDESEESLPCTWDALVQCCEEANLDRVFKKLLRDNIPK